MTGLQTLMRDGFALADVDQPPITAPVLSEVLQWHLVADVMPDADITVLMHTRAADGTMDWCSGWWDGERWRDSTGWPLENEQHFTVTHWAQPQGPQA